MDSSIFRVHEGSYRKLRIYNRGIKCMISQYHRYKANCVKYRREKYNFNCTDIHTFRLPSAYKKKKKQQHENRCRSQRSRIVGIFSLKSHEIMTFHLKGTYLLKLKNYFYFLCMKWLTGAF